MRACALRALLKQGFKVAHTISCKTLVVMVIGRRPGAFESR